MRAGRGSDLMVNKNGITFVRIGWTKLTSTRQA
jgi:hypothetical protein